MPNPHISTQDWFYHAPATKPAGPSNSVLPAPSQIPGLSSIPEDPVEEEDDRRFRRKWIRDPDSKYVKLAKAGGRKHLLTFNTSSNLSSKPVLYPRVDWFDHQEQSEEDKSVSNKANEQIKNPTVLPEWYVHNQDVDEMEVAEKQASDVTNVSQKRPPLGFDSLTVWQRESQQAEESLKSKSGQLPKISKNKSSIRTKLTRQPVKLPKVKSGTVGCDTTHQDMKKLLSMDYQREWLLNKSVEDTKEMKAKQKLEKEQLERGKRIATRHRQSLKPKKEITEEKPLFKLSRFNKIKPCVDTRWSKLEESTDKSVAH